MTMVDHEIRRALQDGAIIIRAQGLTSDEIERRIGVNSFDVSLGRFLWRRQSLIRQLDEKLLRTTGRIELNAESLYAPRYERADGHVVLGPYEKILGVTHEFIGGTVAADGSYAVLAHMHAKSSTGRYGITTNLCAGFGDVGFINRWAMEIANLDPITKRIPVGMLIAQIEFTRVGVPERLYGDRGTYQQGQDIEAIMQQWHPRQMLPKTIDGQNPAHAFPIPQERESWEPVPKCDPDHKAAQNDAQSD